MSDNLPENPYQTPDASSGSIKSKFWSRLCTAGIVFAILFVLIGLLLPAQRRACEAAPRLECQRHMREVGLALHNYYSEHKEFPPAFSMDANGNPLHSWRALILPYLGKEYADTCAKIDFSKPWDDPANEAVRRAKAPVLFRCPSVKLPLGYTTYLAIVTPDSCIRPGRGRTFTEIVDGANNTIVVYDAPAVHAVHWMCPQDANLEMLLSIGSETTMPHTGGYGNFLYCDNNIQTLHRSIDKAVLKALVTVDGGEEIPKNN